MLLTASFVLAGEAVYAQAVEPVPVIVETDLGNDIDDALALDLVYQAVCDGKIDLKMVSVHKKSPTACAYADIQNRWYGYPEVCVAQARTPVDNHQARDYTVPVVESGTFPGSGHYADGTFPDAVTRYRRLLSYSEDRSVVIISLGFATTLAQLLDTPPDEYSTFNGRELVSRKVKYLSIMAGSYGPKQRAEFNVVNDIPAMQKLFDQWPTPIYQNPFELGKMVLYPASAVEPQEGHPVFDAYKAYQRMPYDRPSWDILSVAWVLHPELFGVGEDVTVSVDEKGFNHVRPGGKHHILSLTQQQADSLKAYVVAETTRGPRYLTPWQEGYLDIHSLATGQGDCTFLALPDGTTWMIDAGDIGMPKGRPGWSGTIPDDRISAPDRIVDYIRHFSPSPDHLDYVMVTHFHTDHMGARRKGMRIGPDGYVLSGLSEVGRHIRFDRLIDRDWPDYSFPSRDNILKECNFMKDYWKFCEVMQERGMKMERFDVGSASQFVLLKDPRTYKGTFEVRNLCANARAWTGKGTKSRLMYTGDPLLFDENLNSCGILLRYGDFTYYNCGDLAGGNHPAYPSHDRAQEDFLADVVGKITVMKNGHHGSIDSSSPKLIAASRPEVHLFMAAHRQHPYTGTMRRLTDRLLYPDPREFFVTSEWGRKDLGEEMWWYLRPCGHIVVRVYPGGKQYQMFVLDVNAGDYRIKYTGPVKDVQK